MKPVSLADITYEQGLKLLALRKQAMDQGRIRRMTPEALANTLILRDIGHDYAEKSAEGNFLDSLKSGIGQLGQQAQSGLSQAKNYFQNLDPASRNTLLAGLAGTGLGAATGLGQAVMSGDDNYLTSALRGGVAGGALGGGLGLAMNPGVAEKLYGQGRGIVDQVKQQAKSKPEQTAANAPAAPANKPDINQLQQLSSTANSYAPEAVLGAGLAGTAAGTAYGVGKSLSRKTYDPKMLAEQLLGKAEDAAKAKTNDARTAYGLLLDDNPTATTAQTVLDEAAAKRPVSVEDIEYLLKQQGHKPSLLGSIFGRDEAFGNKPTLALAAQALGKKVDDVKPLITRSGWRGFRNPRSIIPSLIAALGTGTAGAFLGNYQNNQNERAQAQQDYSNLANSYLQNQ